jgi:outer membrane lipoprotein-sorting protein
MIANLFAVLFSLLIGEHALVADSAQAAIAPALEAPALEAAPAGPAAIAAPRRALPAPAQAAPAVPVEVAVAPVELAAVPQQVTSGVSSLLPLLPLDLVPASLVAQGDLSADQVVARVQAFYKETQQLTAKFRQTYTNQTFGRPTVSDGMVWIKKPGKMRWDYQGRRGTVRKSFISDGSTLWSVEHDNKQVARMNLENNLLPVAVTFLYGKGNLATDFTAKLDTSGTYGAKTDHVLELKPRTPSAQYKTLYLVVDPRDFRVKQSIVVEASNNTNHFRFFEPDTRRAVADSWFVFNEREFKHYRLFEPDKEKPARP